MKQVFHYLFAILFLSIAGEASATVTAQTTVTFSGKDVPLEQVFSAVKKQTGYTFVYYTEVLQGTHKVTIDAKSLPVEQFLEACLKDEPLTYKIIGQTVMITKKNNSLVEGTDKKDPNSVKGKIVDDKGAPLAGASVVVKGTNNGTTSGRDGDFILKGVEEGRTLVVSYTGFTVKEVPIGRNASVIIELRQATNLLDQAQVIAYGVTTKRLSTGDVSTVSKEAIEKQPVSNPLLALEGRVPGLLITQNTGLPGGGISVLVQGRNSLLNGNDPFYVIDGVPYTSELLPNLSGALLGISGAGGNAQGGNPLNYINPSDIESISVLKDADATAIYGSRAANGAILITTKRGKAGQSRFDINVRSGWGKVTRKLQLMNTPQYLQMRNEAIKNDGLTPGPGDYDINGTWDTTRYTDWQKRLLGGTTANTDVNGSISGGNATTQYLVSGTFHRETTLFPGDFSDKKGSMHFSLSNASADEKWHLLVTGSYLVDNNQLPNTDLTGTALTLAPDAPPLYLPNGSLNWAPTTSGSSTWTNPLAGLARTYQNRTNNLIGNAVLSYYILKGLEIKANFGYTNMQSNETTTDPLIAVAPEVRQYLLRSAAYANNNIRSWLVEPQLNYVRNFGGAKLEALVGTTIQQMNSNGTQVQGTGYNSDLGLEDIHQAATLSTSQSVISTYKYNAIFGRLNFNWDDKYLANIAIRRDGTSRFGVDNEFHDFSSLGAAWVFTKEHFFTDKLPFLSFGKLRASYGTTGNDQIGDYRYLNLYNITNAQIAYQGATGLETANLYNPHLQWELTRKLSMGLDLGILRDRVILNLSYFSNRSSNQLIPYALPITTGFLSILNNFPAVVENTGWEMSITSTNIKTNAFTWSTAFNVTIPKNKLIKFPDLENSSYANSYIIGQPITVMKAYHFAGVDPATGTYQFKDAHGGLTANPDPTVDNISLVNQDPKFYGGLENTFSYKGFQLSFLFQFTKRTGLNYRFGTFVPGVFNLNEPTHLLSRWKSSGDITNIQRYNSDYSTILPFINAAFASDAAYSDASYIRLKNLSFSWQLPKNWNNKAGLQSARLYVQAQNLFTITHYIGLDPENTSVTSLPPLRILMVGMQVMF